MGPLGQPSAYSHKPAGFLSTKAMANESGKGSQLRGQQSRTTKNSYATMPVWALLLDEKALDPWPPCPP